MKKIIDLEKARLNGILGLIVMIVLLTFCVGLSFYLFHNPHRDLQKQVFKTASAVRNYYRDRPGYWRLSTDTALNDGILSEAFVKKYRDNNIQVGQGVDGSLSLPSDASFDITVKHLNKSACISLCEMSVSDEDELALMKITIFNDTNNVEFSWGGEHPLPIKKYSARDYCQADENTVMWTFQ